MAKSKGIDWSLRVAEAIKATSEFPTDITFKIEEDGNEYEVEAHRLVLGLASEVFKNMLFVTRTDDQTAKEISVKETTVAAFRAMVDAIYNTKTIQESLKDKTVHEMFNVLNLVKKYKIPELVLTTRVCLATYPLSEEQVLAVAGDAIKYLNIFDEEAKELLLQCATFLEPKLSDAKSILKFSAANEAHRDIMGELFALMDSIKPGQCDNCSQVSCKDGQRVTEGELRLGLKVVSYHCRNDIIGCRGTVDSIRGDMVKLKNCHAANEQFYIRPGVEYSVKYKGRLRFRFCCDTALV